MASETRIAAAIVLTRRTARGTEYFLVERAPELRFFGGYFACPGGVLDAAEHAAILAARAANDAARAERVLEECAERELFEETGVVALKGVPHLTAAERGKMREQLVAGDTSAWDRFRGGAPPASLLTSLCRMVTPPFAPVRYETAFFLLELPASEAPEVWRGELASGAFFTPEAALAQWRAGSISIVPPVLFLLEQACSGEAGTFGTRVRAECARLDAGRLHPVRFTPGVFMAPLAARTRPPATTTNCLLLGEQRLYIVDPAPEEGSEIERLCERIEDARAKGAVLEGVLLTHDHPDHVGALPALSACYRLPVLAHGATLARMPYAPEAVRELQDGDVLDLGFAPDGSPGWKLHVLHTPGHTPGHLAFVENRYRAALVGDLVSTLSTMVIDPEDGGHLATYIESLRRVLAFGIGTLYPGHGPAARNGAATLERYLAHRTVREEKLLSALTSHPLPLDALLAGVYDDVDPALHELASKSLLAGLYKLEEEGRAERRADFWQRGYRSPRNR